MASANPTNLVQILKVLYPKGIAFPGYKRSRFLSLCSKDSKFGGEGKYIVVDVAPTAGGSADFDTALSNMDPSSVKRFFLTHRKEYQLASLSGDVMARSMGDKNAIVQALKHEFDKAGYAFGRALSARIWGNGGGSLGVIDATTVLASTDLVLATRTDVTRFEVGMYCQFSVDDGTGTSPAGTRDAGNQLKVVSIDRDTGTITFDANLNTIAGIALADNVFRSGDYANAMTGILGWIPVTAPTAGDSFFGLDRSASDVVRLSGIRVNGGGAPKEETLIDACAEAHLNGAEPDTCFMNPLDFRDLVKELGSKKEYDDVNAAGVSFNAIKIHAHSGEVRVVSEADVPRGNSWLLTMKDWQLCTAGDCPSILNEDNAGRMLREATSDAYQFRMGAYGNLACNSPGHQVVITW